MMSSGCMYAQTQRLVVWLKNGEKVLFDLEERPKTMFSGTDIVIETTNMTVTYSLSQVLRYTYEGNSSGVEIVKSSKDIHVIQKGDELSFENLSNGSIIQLFSTEGILLESWPVKDNPIMTISLANRPTGVYIVKTDGVTYKMMKR